MRRKFYNLFIKPISKDSDQAEREVVLNYLLIGILGLSIIAFIVTLLAPVISGEPAFPGRLVNNFITILFIVVLYFTARYIKQYRLVAVLLTSLIALFGCFIGSQWSILDPHSALLLSLAVVMASILIGARYSLYLVAVLITVLIYLQHGQSTGSLHPDLSWMRQKPVPGDVIGFSAILSVIALVSWLFNRQMELSLKRARRSEKALQRQRDLLEVKVEKRARQLEQAQLERMQQLYRFAELGQLSTALFHDLASHLSTVNLDVEGLSGAGQPQITRRIQENVGHINDIVKRVRQQIGGKSNLEIFDIRDEIEEVVKILEPTAEQAKVQVMVTADKSVKPLLSYKGDVTRFRQVILNLVCNGIEAYSERTSKKAGPKEVDVALSRQGSSLLISVNDHGAGIQEANRAKIFKPFYTTKAKGIGIGLFIVKQIVENDFNGVIAVASDRQQGTTFSINIPKTYYAKISKH